MTSIKAAPYRWRSSCYAPMISIPRTPRARRRNIDDVRLLTALRPQPSEPPRPDSHPASRTEPAATPPAARQIATAMMLEADDRIARTGMTADADAPAQAIAPVQDLTELDQIIAAVTALPALPSAPVAGMGRGR